MLQDFEKDYRKIKTKELLNILGSLRAILNRGTITVFHEKIEANEKNKLILMITAIKKELSHREHIPNKKERKIIRQNKFK